MWQCMPVWSSLKLFWLHGNSSIKAKLLVWNAVIRSKLLYGLIGSWITEATRRFLQTFQLRGLRRILQLPTTFVNRAYTND